MKLLFISYNLGKTASGIISERVLREFLYQGDEVVVVTESNDTQYKLNCQVIEVKNVLREGSYLYRLWQKLISIFCIPFNSNLVWRIRVYYRMRKLFRKWRPEIIYCRTSPIDPCFVGALLKEKYSIPLCSNLTDPLPPPVEYIPEGKYRNRLIESAIKIISFSDLIGMGTQQGIDYQMRITGIKFSDKAFLSPDPIPYSGMRYFDYNNEAGIQLLYLGAIYASRNINPLICAIKQLRDQGHNISLTIYGSYINHNADIVKCHQWIDNVDKIIGDFDILVDLDGDDEEPVFVSSKLKQYLVYNRPVLSITPKNSPTSVLLKDLATAEVVVNDSMQIIDRLGMMIKKEYNNNMYQERNHLLQLLSPSKIVTDLKCRLSAVLNGLE